MTRIVRIACLAAAGLLAAGAAGAEGIEAEPGGAIAAFDILRAELRRDGEELVFRMTVAGEAGSALPAAVGAVAGAGVHAYVWPTSLDSAAVGFEAGQGVLALAATAHPDFDDTPLEDEDGDGDPANDGRLWHSHWVVLAPDDGCGPGALKVKDIPEGAQPRLPARWPGLPILIDSPGYPPSLAGEVIEVRLPAADLGAPEGLSYDAVTAALRVHADMHAPLLCVVDLFDVASGDLSLPGTLE